jgi:hypothetical protein
MPEYTEITMSDLIEETLGEFDTAVFRVPTDIAYAAGYRRAFSDMVQMGDPATIHQYLLTLSYYMGDDD